MSRGVDLGASRLPHNHLIRGLITVTKGFPWNPLETLGNSDMGTVREY